MSHYTTIKPRPRAKQTPRISNHDDSIILHSFSREDFFIFNQIPSRAGSRELVQMVEPAGQNLGTGVIPSEGLDRSPVQLMCITHELGVESQRPQEVPHPGPGAPGLRVPVDRDVAGELLQAAEVIDFADEDTG